MTGSEFASTICLDNSNAIFC